MKQEIKPVEETKPTGVLMKSTIGLFRAVGFLDVFSWLSGGNHNELGWEIKPIGPSISRQSIVDITVLLKLVIAIALFISIGSHWIVTAAVLYLLIGTVTSAPRAILLRKQRLPIASFSRAFVLGFINLVEIVIHYGSLYKLLLPGTGPGGEVFQWADYIMYSIATVTTASFPMAGIKVEDSIRLMLEITMISQAFVCFGFIIFVLSSNISNLVKSN